MLILINLCRILLLQVGLSSWVPLLLCQLLLRVRQGALFSGQFYLFNGNPSVWYEADCIVTNAALSFAPGQVVDSRIEFVTTGPVELKTGLPESFMLQESDDLILQESADAMLLEDPS